MWEKLISKSSLYLDYNATSPLSSSVTEWLKSGDVIFANPSSQHSSGKAARKSINEARATIYSVFHKGEKENRLLFHSGATEAFLTVAWSMSEMARTTGKKLLIAYAKTDHPAVTSLGDRHWGNHVSNFELKLKSDLSYDHSANLSELKSLKDKTPELIILYHHLWVHNETGLVSPLEELSALKKISDLYLHIDAVQAPGKIPEWRNLAQGDIWSFSAHKFGALKGVGFSLVREGIPFHALLLGGGQQQGMRGGTENPLGIKSIALALQDLTRVDVKKTTELKESLVNFIKDELKGLGDLVLPAHRNSNTIYFYLNNLPSDVGLALFDLQGLALSAGSACSSGAARPSIILSQLGFTDIAKNGLRISLKLDFSEELLNEVKSRLSAVFNRLRS